ncbi:uncharacterized protein LOC112127812 [Cimex lectularius]|uniref:Uncharacterized protein n=1 Tax=Cimex lectularius TaxID=79782 RepID=A0A8I6SSQ2_CIMLE|nr:uncharacterized protein LOC112127812 [Cimex lectularius]
MCANVVSMDLLEFLLTSPNVFQSLPLPQKQEIVSKRPTPNIDLSSNDEEGIIHFDVEWYSAYDWLTGSRQRKKLYCFICLVIGQCTQVADLFSSLKNFHKKAHAHETSKGHVQCSEKFVRILTYNKKVNPIEFVQAKDFFKIRRNLFKKFVRFLALTNKTKFLQLIPVYTDCFKDSVDFLANNDIHFPYDWENHLKSVTNNDAQNEILDLLHEGVKEHIRHEIANCDFVSVQVDDMSEYTSRPTFSILFRYLVNYKVVERFAGFFEIPKDQSELYFCETVLNLIKDWGAEDKLVCVSNDSKATKLTSNKLQERNILWLHSANYNLNLVLLKVAFDHPDVREFAGFVATIASFFSDVKRDMRLRAEGYPVPREFTEPGASLETYIWIIKTKFTQLDSAIVYILESGNWDLETTCMAKFIYDIMQSDVFVYLLCLFSRTFIISDHVSCVMRIISFKNLKMCADEINQFFTNIKDIQSPSSLRKIHVESVKMRERKNTQPKQVVLNKLTEEIIRLMQQELGSMFFDHSKLKFFQLLDEQKFETFGKAFPYDNLMDLTALYSFFDEERLETELAVIYEDNTKRVPARDLYLYIVENGLVSIYPQTLKLIGLFLTLPVYVAEENAEKRTYERIKKFAKCYATLEHFSRQGMLLIEDALLMELLNNEDIMDTFVDAYCQNHNLFHPV